MSLAQPLARRTVSFLGYMLERPVASLAVIAALQLLAAGSGCAQNNVILRRSAVAAQHLADTTTKLDPGIALVSPVGGSARDSLRLFQTSADSVTWGWFIRDLSGADSLPFALWTPIPLQPNIMEFTYEESGLPVDSIVGDRVRVLLGWDDARRMRRAWVRLDSTVTLHRWSEWLKQSPLFFRPGYPADFYAAPRGARFPIVIPGGDEPDYIMHAKRVSGQWMQVEIVTPSDYCEEETTRFRRETVWIRYLDQAARPRVWYYTRGC